MHELKWAIIEEVGSKNEARIEIPPGFVVFCDMDGTLIDTDFANFLSYRCAVIKATCGKHDIEFNGERLNRENLKNQLPSLTTAECENIASLKTRYFTKFLSRTILNTTLAELIFNFSKTNDLILVTSSRTNRAIETLRYHKLLNYFSQLVCFESASQVNPLNKYSSALSITGTCPEKALVFENDRADMEKAVHAGIPRSNIISVLR